MAQRGAGAVIEGQRGEVALSAVVQSELAVVRDGRIDFRPHPGQWRAWVAEERVVLVLAGTQGGKALALDTPVWTSLGPVAMGDLREGDEVYDESGRPTRVAYASPVFTGRDCYRVSFDDGTSVVADADHEWVVQERRHRRADRASFGGRSVVTTRRMAGSVMDGPHRRYSVGGPPVLEGRPWAAPVPPYTLGAWLGDGCSTSARLFTADEEVLDGVRAEGVSVGPPHKCNGGAARSHLLGGGPQGGDMQGELRALGVLGDKRVPEAYQGAPAADRLALLRGIMDTDGSCGADGGCELVLKSDGLAADVVRLLRGLGIKARMVMRRATIGGVDKGPVNRVNFTTPLQVFTVARKARRRRVPPATRVDTRRRYVVSVEAVDSVPVRCIAVEAESRQFLCGDGAVPTHNTSFGPHWLYREIQRRGPGDYMIVTPTYPLLEKKALPEFRKLFERWLQVGNYVSSPVRVFRFSADGTARTFDRDRWAPGVETEQQWRSWLADNPTTVQFGYAEDPESLESATAKAAWLDEAGQRKFRVAAWEAIRRRLSIHQGRVLITTTPYDLGWLKQTLHDRWRDGDPDINVVRFDSTENPVFPQAEFDSARKTMPRWKFDLFYRGIFTRPAGMIYGCFRDWVGRNPEDPAAGPGHLCRRFDVPASWPRYVGLDFGGTNTAALVLAQEHAGNGRPTGRFYAVEEYHEGGLTCEGHVGKIKARAGGQIRAAVGGSKSEDQWRREFKKAGLPVMEPPISDVEVGIGRVFASHAEDRIVAFDDLARYRDEKTSYGRVLDEGGEPTEAIEDKHSYHVMDAERYIVSWLRHPRRGAAAVGGTRPMIDAAKAALR